MVRVKGELWRARPAEGEALVPGEHVLVEEVEDGLTLVVGSGASHSEKELTR
jgi:membrane protein implicated in regulation of membrane protease activity